MPSRKRAVVLRQQLQSWGIKEVSLIAQDLTYFGRERNGEETLEGLLQALIKETDIAWFRLMYAYPAFLTDAREYDLEAKLLP